MQESHALNEPGVSLLHARQNDTIYGHLHRFQSLLFTHLSLNVKIIKSIISFQNNAVAHLQVQFDSRISPTRLYSSILQDESLHSRPRASSGGVLSAGRQDAKVLLQCVEIFLHLLKNSSKDSYFPDEQQLARFARCAFGCMARCRRAA